MSGLPRLGFALPTSGAGATPEAMIGVARRAEERGWASLWTFQRLLQPVDGRDPAYEREHNPSSRPIDDDAYRAVHDPLLPLAHVASHTTRIRLGTATICAPFVAPPLLAKAAATLDHLTAGRFTLGVGMGWLPQEYTAAGAPFERRGARMEEYLRCLRAMWADDPVSFEGQFHTVPTSNTGIKPVQVRLPVLVGGASPAALRRAGRSAEGWIGGTGLTPEDVARSVALVREGAAAAGRDPDAVQALARMAVELVDRDPGRHRRPGHGTPAQVLDDAAVLGASGATEVLIDPRVPEDPEATTAEAERLLDALAPAVG